MKPEFRVTPPYKLWAALLPLTVSQHSDSKLITIGSQHFTNHFPEFSYGIAIDDTQALDNISEDL